MNRTLGITMAALLGVAAARAEFRYTETTKFTGGALAGVSRTLGVFSRSMRSLTEPQTRTTMVQGNQMVSFDNRSMHITDLDAETITEVDLEKKTYSVITFAQMAEAMRKGIQRHIRNSPTSPRMKTILTSVGRIRRSNLKNATIRLRSTFLRSMSIPASSLSFGVL